MNPKLLDAMLLVVGTAVIVNGRLGRDLRNDVEMPMNRDERAVQAPPTKLARIIYILCGCGLVIYGFTELFFRRLH